jgi:CheY-like chemotaxis protein
MLILYVENHEVFARITASQFLAEHDVTVVATVAEAKTHLQQHSYGLVLVDYDLDDAKGDELVRWIRQRGYRAHIVAVSAKDEANQFMTEAGADAACNKLNFNQLPAILAYLKNQKIP